MSISVSWLKDCEFKITTSDGFELLADADSKVAPCPTEILLSALGSCSATDVVMGLEEKGIKIESLTNTLTFTLTDSSPDSAPQLYKTVNLHFTVKANNVTEQQIASAAENAINKYCHVCLMLQPTIDITFTVELIK